MERVPRRTYLCAAMCHCESWMDALAAQRGVVLILACLTAVGGGSFCGLDTGYTTIKDGRGARHSVFISYKSDGTLWARLGPSHMAMDWNYDRERIHRYQATILDQAGLAFLREVHYLDHCVVSDMNLQVWAEGGWHPSYLSVFDAATKDTNIVSFKYKSEENCYLQTNFSISPDKQGLFCDGGRTNLCGFRYLPERRHISKTMFLHIIKMDPRGPDHWSCQEDNAGNMYTLHGSYYHVYVKLGDCKAPWDSRSFGHEAKLRSREDSHQNAILIPDPTQSAISGGTIIGWKVFNKVISVEHEVYLQVWRRTEHINRYTLVGQTFYQPAELRSHEVVLDPQHYIRIHEGDILGLYFPKYNPFAWDSVPCAYQSQRYRYIDDPIDVAVGTTKQFLAAPGGWDACRQYSFQALFANKSDSKLVHDWVCPTDEPPYAMGELNKDVYLNDVSQRGRDNVDNNNDPQRPPLSSLYNGLIPLHLILIIAACLILMLIIIGFISYYKAVRS